MYKSHQQPRGFSVFFLTEMWERYGFYVIQTVLVFYLLQHLHLKDSQAYIIVGSFTALAYINCIFGGLIADRLIGYNKAVIIGGILLFLGYFTVSSSNTLNLITLGLAAITVGTGMLKPNVSSLLSVLYRKHQELKDAGYTLYYVGIYVGATSGSLLGGYLKTWFGWHSSFISSAVGALLSLTVFIYGCNRYKLSDQRHNQIRFLAIAKSILSVLILILISYYVLQSDLLSLVYFGIIAIFCLGFIVYCIVTHHGVERNRLIAFLVLVLLAVLYWAIYFQQFFSISLATDRVVNRSFSTIFSFHHIVIPSSSIPAIESVGVILFGPLINYMWFKLQDKGRGVSIATKFSLGFLFNSICFLLLAGGLWLSYQTNNYMSIWFIVVAYLLVSIGELSISPTSLSMVTSLVPERLTSAMMGISLLSIGFGGKLAGFLALGASINKSNDTLSAMKYTYMTSFFSYFLISLVTFIVALMLIKFIGKLITAQPVQR